MASDPDDNPFARNSAWPKMPQAPFRMGGLPKAGAAEETPTPVEPPAAPATITPVFVRPADPAPQPAAAARPTFITRPPPQPAQVARPAAAPPRAEAAPPSRPPPQPAPAAVEPPVRPPVELEPLVIQPPARPRATSARASTNRTPAIAAAAVGVLALAGLIFALSQGREAAPRAPAPARAMVTTTQQSVAARAPTPPAATPVSEAPQPAARRIVTTRSTPSVAAAVSRTAASRAATPPAPVLALPPAAPEPVVITPAPAVAEPLPTYTPPTTPDPNAPMTTRRPY
ncbi:MAG: hypothetical protein AB1942_14770 [Pseudomonadota bacterium]